MANMKSKILSLLKKAKSTDHQQEAETFLKKAKELMLKHQISMMELTELEQRAEDPMGTGKSGPFQPGTPASEKYRLEQAVAQYFGCAVFTVSFGDGRRRVVEYHGRLSARVTHEAMFPFIWNQVCYLSRRYGGSEVRKLRRDTSRALFNRIGRLIYERDKAPDTPTKGFELALVDEAENYALSQYDGKIGKARIPKHKDPTDLARALAAEISLDQQLNEDEERKQIQ